MKSRQRKMQWAGALAVLTMAALLVSCKGFFVDPKLTAIAVGPATPTIQTGTTGNTVQMTASGTYNDGSTGNPSVTWTSTPTVPGGPTVASISSGGLATAASLGTTTITATSTQNSTIAGTTTLTVTVGCIQSIAVTPATDSVNVGTPVQYKAEATTCNGQFDITSVATWASSNTADVTIDSTGLATTVAKGTVSITATSGGVVSSPAATLMVN